MLAMQTVLAIYEPARQLVGMLTGLEAKLLRDPLSQPQQHQPVIRARRSSNVRLFGNTGLVLHIVGNL